MVGDAALLRVDVERARLLRPAGRRALALAWGMEDGRHGSPSADGRGPALHDRRLSGGEQSLPACPDLRVAAGSPLPRGPDDPAPPATARRLGPELLVEDLSDEAVEGA